ncbi:MAG: isoprenylcysteine carboxylmethyltransferase family protein [Rhodocyclaceae bacterium]|nr:isoprenylcysteine carboxylmethyltransferase family protein [Rhodocyclaceae bacterium]
MHKLELKVPPPLVALILGIAMSGISLFTATVEVSSLARIVISIAIALVGGAFSLLGAIAFRRAQTTVNPMKPERASSLVTGGVYQVTRNPMYVGLLLVLLGWAVFLAAPWSLVGPVAFVFYISRFQILPEERVLTPLFGEAYSNYKKKVRRWL